jgi:hypothetical protein
VKSLATAGKSFKKFQKIVKKAYGEKALKRMKIYVIDYQRQRRRNPLWQQQIRGTATEMLPSPISLPR